MTDFPAPPAARQQRRESTIHGLTLVDDYFWLRERDNPDVLAHLQAENEYTEQMLAHTEQLREQLYTEMRSRIKETDETVPTRKDEYFYYSRTEQDQQYPIFCRKHGSLDAPEEVLLDQNALAEGHDYFRIGAFRVSPNHRLLAYSADTSGAEQYTLFIKDLATGELLADQIPNTYYGVEWANDNRTIFYNVLDAAMRPYKLLRHVIGSEPAADDEEVFHEADESFFLWVSKTRSDAYLLMTLHSTTSTEVWYLPADQPQSQWQVIAPRRPNIEYSVAHQGEHWLIVTNDDAKNFKLMIAPLDSPAPQHWRELVAHRPDVLIDDVDAFADYIVLYERERGLKRIRISDPQGQNVRYVEFPEPVYTYTPGPNEEYASHVLRFMYTSLITPKSVIDYDMRDGTWTQRKQDEIPSGYDASLYRTERIYATAPDGVSVPMSIVYPRNIARDGTNPTLLYGYGSYGFSVDPNFSTNWLSLLQRGFVIAIAHIRGGSEMGREWYEQGKLSNKRNTFTDFIACAEHLIAQGYTSPPKLGIMGGSAGGLLMGAVVNLRPDLFGAVVAKVPFVDVINTMLDPTLPLTVIEYEQWGNPNEPQAFEYIRSYSPYDNLEAKAYPHILATAGLNDPRVSYWEPAKWVAKLRTLKTNANLLLLKTNMGAGHGGASGRYEYLREIAFEYAFLLDTLSVKD